MAIFTPLGFQGYYNLILEDYNAQASLPADTQPGSTVGSIINSAAMAAAQLEQQLLYVANDARLATIPALPNGAINPDVDSFCNPFGIYRLGADASEGGVTCTTPSPVSGGPLIVPVGGVLQTAGGLLFTIIADPTNANYNATDVGYPIPNGQSSTIVTVECQTPGTIGNVQAGQINAIFSGPGSTAIVGISTVSNALAFINGTATETDTAYKARFTLLVSSGRVATANAILGAVLSIQTGLTASFGDRVNADLSEHDAYFTLVLAQLGTGAAPSGALLSAATAAINSVRSGGISFQCIAPTLVPIEVVATYLLSPGAISGTVTAALQAAHTAFVNNIGLNPDTTPTNVGYFAYAAAMAAVPGCQELQSLTLNGGSGDVTIPFANMASAGSASFTVA